MKPKVEIYDTTLRDGTQAVGFSLSVKDKTRIALRLNEFGVDYIELGWPGSNPKDNQVFQEIQKYSLNHSEIAAFGSTHHTKYSADEDPNLKALVESGASVITIFGKSYDLHVRKALRVSPERNLELIENSLSWLRPQVSTLFYDAEHFFDGYKANPKYALETLSHAMFGGAECIVLCDTNGGTLPYEITEIVQAVQEFLGNKIQLGIHCHNDAGLAVANTLAAVLAGVTHIQGTINGFGERCGNADLCVIIANLILKMGYQCTAGKNLEELTRLSRFVYETANLPPNDYQPYVGSKAFNHKGGIHASAARYYEHIRPESVGNEQHIPVSELAGRGSILAKAKEFGLLLKKDNPLTANIVNQIKELEARGYQFEVAEASLELLMREAITEIRHFFRVLNFRVVCEGNNEEQEATIKVGVKGEEEHTANDGDGSVNSLDNALRKALEKFYPQIEEMKLLEYKVVNLSSDGTSSLVRVLIKFHNGHEEWWTVGASHDVIKASLQALVDAYRYGLMKYENNNGGEL